MRLCLTVLVVAMSYPTLAAEVPKPFGPLPTDRQVKWQLETEFYGFLHFTVNTFTGKEWGEGDEPEALFNPTAFDADQIVRSCKAAEMKGLILTCKHHDGFCLWPSKYTEHSVKNSPWKNGKGDVVKEISDACRQHGLKFGVYLSPWDRNHKDYGKPEYITYYRNQLRELLTNYGPIFEVWCDSANGGSGYYGGARETRTIDLRTYYDWPNTWAMIRQIQPDAVLFGDPSPDMRWVGAESGVGDPCWATYTPTDLRGQGTPDAATAAPDAVSGHRDGKYWLPVEVDLSIRPGWFYNASQDDSVKSLSRLMQQWFETVGRGAPFLLNVPPDRRGLVHENDAKSLAEFGSMLRKTFGVNLAQSAIPTADNIRGNDTAGFGPHNLLDGNAETYWSTDDAVTTPEVTLNFKQPITFSVVRLREAIRLGQRVDDWALDTWQEGAWKELVHASAIGACHALRTKPITTDRVRLRITKSPVCPAIAELGLYLEAKTP